MLTRENPLPIRPHTDEFEIVSLKSGIKTLRSKERGQTFHPDIGPMTEAEILHVNQQRLIERAPSASPFVIWDVGLGAGANAIAVIRTLLRSSTYPSTIEIHSFDRTLQPLEFALQNSDALDYVLPFQAEIDQLMLTGQVALSNHIKWHLHLSEFQELIQSSRLPSPHSILYDPYSAKENVELWTLEHFKKLRTCLKPENPCIWSNYTRSTAVRVSLLMAGFYVGRGCAIGQKSETTLASNSLELLAYPLDRPWLERLQKSGNAAPLRGPHYSEGPISNEDYRALINSPQFKFSS
jgi:hypothetical protein